MPRSIERERLRREEYERQLALLAAEDAIRKEEWEGGEREEKKIDVKGLEEIKPREDR